MKQAFICDAIRTPIGRFGGVLKDMRADDLGALALRALQERNPTVDWSAVQEVIFGCANQAGEDNRNVARMSLLLAGLPIDVPGVTINRLCGSGMDAVGTASRMIKSGEAGLVIAGGVESMTRAPFVMGKADSAFSRNAQIFDTTIGWRFVNPQMKALYGVDSMPETAENVATDYHISRADQDAFAVASQNKAAAAQASGVLADEIIPVIIPQKKGDSITVMNDEHPRITSVEALGKLKGVVKVDGTITAGNASGINDGAAALVMMRESTAKKLGCTPLARVVSHATFAQEPEWFTTAPVGATQQALARAGWKVSDVQLWEVNEAFAVVPMALMYELNVPHEIVNVNGGACALGHPIGASGARIIVTLLHALQAHGLKKGLATLCIGGGEGTAMALELI